MIFRRDVRAELVSMRIVLTKCFRDEDMAEDRIVVAGGGLAGGVALSAPNGKRAVAGKSAGAGEIGAGIQLGPKPMRSIISRGKGARTAVYAKTASFGCDDIEEINTSHEALNGSAILRRGAPGGSQGTGQGLRGTRSCGTAR